MRSCGTCSLCCKLLGILELEKPQGQWCPHCKPGKERCTIYETRPDTCRTFNCAWLVNESVDDRWYPEKCKMVINMNVDSEIHLLQIYVDPSNRMGWTKEPYYSQIKSLAKNGIDGINGEFYRTEVRLISPKKVYTILPDKDVECPASNGTTEL